MRFAPENDLPVACSVCLQSPASYTPKIRYINCEAGYDGPVVKDPELAESEYGVYMENIVICEGCVREMAALLGLQQVDNLKEYVVGLEAQLDQREAEVAEKDRAISDLSHTVGTLIDKPVKRPAGRPQLRGPDSHEAVIKELRSRKKAKAKPVKIAGKE